MTAKPARKIVRDDYNAIPYQLNAESAENFALRRQRAARDMSAFDYITARKQRNRNKDWSASYPTEAEMKAADTGPIRPQEAFVELAEGDILRLCRMSEKEFQRVLDGERGTKWAANARRLIGARAGFKARMEAENKPRDPFARQLDLD